MVDIRLPNITPGPVEQQLQQVKSYLEQLALQLQHTLPQPAAVPAGQGRVSGGEIREKERNFQEMKALILKSAQVVESLSQEVSHRLEGRFVAASEYGTFSQETALQLQASSQALSQLYTELQQVSGTAEKAWDAVLQNNAYIRSGKLAEGVYGLEIGQQSALNGETVFDRFARFTPNRLSFYDSNDVEVAYISDYKLYITHAQVTGSLSLGDFRVETDQGLAFLYGGV